MEGEDCGAVLLLPSIRPSFEARRALLSIPSRRVSLTSSDAICAPADSSSDTRFDLVFITISLFIDAISSLSYAIVDSFSAFEVLSIVISKLRSE